MTGPVLPSLNLSVLGGDTRADEPLRERLRGARRGDVIGGRYVVDGQIGRGGMGRVLQVRHLALDKPFALKLPKARTAAKPAMRERFYREARLASSLSHDNICSIVDFGEDPRFGLFMVMELLEGQVLHHKLRHDGRLAPRVASDIMSQIAEAMRYVHGRGVLHGDIKSENILIARASDRGRLVKLLDFGLARGKDASGSGAVEGTPEYLAPERIQMQPASQASDIYALGILFYELLVGDVPFRGSMEEVLRRHVNDRVPSLSESIGDELDERADLIIARATAKRPEHRHPNVSAFLYELRTFMSMHGIDGRRRNESSGRLVRKAVDRATRAAAEVFESAPIPLASIDGDGTLVTANRAFLEFLGGPHRAGLRLAETGLLKVYPRLLQDVAEVAESRASVTEIVQVSAGGGQAVEVAVVISAPPTESCLESGEIHIALHPLGRYA